MVHKTEMSSQIVRLKWLTKSSLILLICFAVSHVFAQVPAPKKIDILNGDIIMPGGKKIVNKKYITNKKTVVIKDSTTVPSRLLQRVFTQQQLDSLIFLNTQNLPFEIIYYVGDSDNETYYLYKQISDFLTRKDKVVNFSQRDCRFCQPPEKKTKEINVGVEEGKFFILIRRQQ